MFAHGGFAVPADVSWSEIMGRHRMACPVERSQTLMYIRSLLTHVPVCLSCCMVSASVFKLAGLPCLCSFVDRLIHRLYQLQPRLVVSVSAAHMMHVVRHHQMKKYQQSMSLQSCIEQGYRLR